MHALKAVTLIDPGVPSEIVGWAYVAGVVPIRVCISHFYNIIAIPCIRFVLKIRSM